MKTIIRAFALLMLAAGPLSAKQAALAVVVDGPSEVMAGEDFAYKVHIGNLLEEGSAVLMYYIPPEELECLGASNADEQFEVCYQPDLRRVYGQGSNLTQGVTIDLMMKAGERIEEGTGDQPDQQRRHVICAP